MKKFVPDEPQTGAGIKKKEENGVFSLLLRLARSRSYIETGEIKDSTGAVVPDSNVAKLVAYACRHEPLLPGLAEFCELLESLGIDEVANQNLRTHINAPPLRSPSSPTRLPSPLQPPDSPIRPPSPPLPPPSPSPLAASTTAAPSDDGWNVPLPPSKRRWCSLDDEGDDDAGPVRRSKRIQKAKRRK